MTVRTWSVLVPVVALTAGVLFATSAATARGTDLRSDRRLQLTELVARQGADVARREQQAARLRAGVDTEAEQVAAADARVAAAQVPPAVEVAAGLTALAGPGVRVELDDAPRRPGRPVLAAPDDLVVHQQDLQAVVNALWAGGADGVTLMGRRIVSTSAVRCVGNTVILSGRVYSPPFVVQAIGDPATLRASLDDDAGVRFFRTFVERFGLGYDVRTVRGLQLPAYDGALTLPVSAGGGSRP